MPEKSESVDAYIARFSPDAQKIMMELRPIIRQTVPDAQETIAYNVPFYYYHGPFVGFSAFTGHISLGIGSNVLSEEERAALERRGYKLGASTVQISFGQSVPAEEIRAILLRKARISEESHPHEH